MAALGNMLRTGTGLLLRSSSASTYKGVRRSLHIASPLHKEVELTRKRYQISRGGFAQVTPSDLEVFRDVLGPEGVVTSDLDGFNTDWLGSVRGESRVLLRPRTTEQVSQIIRHCNERKIAVCPQGGNTGLVGGSVPVFDEVILSTSLMNTVEGVDVDSGVLRCQAGCVLQSLDQHLEQFQLMMPLDLGAKGSCQIGGNVATNAGGLRLVRYGSLHHSVLGLEVVLPSGEVLDLMSGLRKDNTGYHLKHLMIGAEGTLGVVTKVAMLCPPRPASVQLAFLALEDFPTALTIGRLAKSALGEVLSSLEFVDAEAQRCVESNLGLTCPVGTAPCYVLVETSGSNAEHDREKLETFLETCLETAGVLDGTLATEPSKVEKLWQSRERIAEATLADGYVYKYDVSLPLPDYYTLVERARDHLGDRVTRCCGYGHLGDGNLHLNISAPEYDEETSNMLEPWVFEQTSGLGGSVSAEHGMGFKKRNVGFYTKSGPALQLMADVKKMLDPNGIMNPYKVLPDQ